MGSGAKIWSEKLRSIPELDSTGMRCDLHPKWSFDGAYFAVDTMNDGCRGIYLYAMGAGRQALSGNRLFYRGPLAGWWNARVTAATGSRF